MNGSNYVKIPLRSSAILNIEKDDKSTFLFRIVILRVLNYRRYIDELIIQGFNFSNGFKCSDVHKFQKPNNISINFFELSF